MTASDILAQDELGALRLRRRRVCKEGPTHTAPYRISRMTDPRRRLTPEVAQAQLNGARPLSLRHRARTIYHSSMRRMFLSVHFRRTAIHDRRCGIKSDAVEFEREGSGLRRIRPTWKANPVLFGSRVINTLTAMTARELGYVDEFNESDVFCF
ncbi:hypothetical protein EVAR_87129_1 [Eumeta japonica]|uniref:Uncharacterized protein n=1 Tax=Eumeta variegata TaxID=151549 RepID=A0A4C1VTY9_EUMVA|nr:hypothetical protein EVAR_87129_1 [Eumeta japonica]